MQAPNESAKTTHTIVVTWISFSCVTPPLSVSPPRRYSQPRLIEASDGAGQLVSGACQRRLPGKVSYKSAAACY